MRHQRFGMIVAVMLSMTACLGGGGGGGGDTGGGGAPQNPVNTGTTVQGPSGASVVIPPGAAPSNTQIVITQSSAGAPSLPTGSTLLGQVFAFTPHGTTFSAPVTVTIPFDPTLVPSGATPKLYKTNSGNVQWEEVVGATVSGSTMSGSVTSFSYLAAVADPLPMVENPVRFWEFRRHFADLNSELIKGNTETRVPAPDGVLDEEQHFGLLSFQPEPNHIFAMGELFSTATGRTYWVEAEAPVPDVPLNMDWKANVVGGGSKLLQKQSYRKDANNATLDLWITDARFRAADFNGTVPRRYVCPWEGENAQHARCLDIMKGSIEMRVRVLPGREGDDMGPRVPYELHDSTLRLEGYTNNFVFTVSSIADDPDDWRLGAYEGRAKPIFRESHFVRTDADMTEIALREPVRVRIDLSQVPLHAEFTVDTSVLTRAEDRRRGEAYMKARLRDPVNTGGVAVEFTGLTPTNRPVLSPEIGSPPPPPQCTSASDPEAGVVAFNSASGLIHEFGAISPPLYLTRTGGSRGTIVATVTSGDDSAIAGTHYASFSRTYVFGDGDDVPRQISIAPIDNNTADGDVVLRVSLSAPAGCPQVGDLDAAEITILDDEARPVDESYSVGGTVSGLAGTGLVLEEVRTGMRVTPSNGVFTFNYAYQDGFDYNVRLVTQPTNPLQTCSVANATGTIAGADITNVIVTCTTPLPQGSLDPTFGASGKVTAALAGGAIAVGLQSDGRILVLGERSLHRYASDGSVDNTFGTNGQVSVNFTGGSFDVVRDMAVLSDDKIVIVGYARAGSQDDFAAARYNADGTQDYSFGSAGKAYVDFNGLTDRAHDVDIQSDGGILLSGHAGVTSNIGPANDFAIARLTAAGVIDTTFDGDGKATVNIAGATDLGAAAALQSDGAIVIVGRVGESGGAIQDVGAVRFTSTGALDATFGAGGIVRIDYAATGSDEATDVAVQSDGKIVLVGFATVAATADYLIARLNANGTRDTAFGTNGMTTLAFGTSQDAADALELQPDGGILVVGMASSSTVTDMGIARYLSNGTLDTAFGGSGTLSIDFFGAADGADALVIQADGKVIVAGSARNGTSNGLGLIRVTP